MNKNQFEEQIKEEQTKKRLKFSGLKKVVALSLAGLASVALAACNFSLSNSSSSSKNNSQSSSGYETSIDSSSSGNSSSSNSSSGNSSNENSSSGNGNSSSEKESFKDPIPYQKIGEFIGNLKVDNYSFRHDTDRGSTSYYFADDLMYVKEHNDKEYGVFYYYIDDKMYKMEYNDTDKNWERSACEKNYDYSKIAYDYLNSTDWRAYDAETNTAKGNRIDVDYFVNLTTGVVYGDIQGEFFNVNRTVLHLPTDYIDKDNPTSIKNPNQPIYEIKNGEYVFDVVAIKDVLLTWMKGENQFGKDVIADKFVADYITDEIVYIKATEERIELGFTYRNDNIKYFQSAYFKEDTDLYNKIKNGSIKTKYDFMVYLKGIKRTKFNLTRDAVTVDTEVSNIDFNTLTERVFDRLENKGTQGNSVNNDFPSTKLKDFSKAKVLYGFKTQRSNESAGGDLGFGRAWNQYYLVEYNGQIEFIKCAVASSTTNNSNELHNVLENNEDKWMVSTIEREVVNNANSKLYETTSTKTINYVLPTMVINKKEREFV